MELKIVIEFFDNNGNGLEQIKGTQRTETWTTQEILQLIKDKHYIASDTPDYIDYSIIEVESE